VLGFFGGFDLSEELELEKLRDEIAKVTLEIFNLCRERIELSKKIALVKSRRMLPIEDLEVEESLKRRLLSFCRENNLDEEFCTKLFNLLICESKRVQNNVMKTIRQT